MKESEELNEWVKEEAAAGAAGPSDQDDFKDVRAWPRKNFEAPLALFVNNAEAAGTLKNVSVGDSIVSVEIRVDTDLDKLILEPDVEVRVDIPWLAVIGGVGSIVRISAKDDGTYIAVRFENAEGKISQRTIDQILLQSAP